MLEGTLTIGKINNVAKRGERPKKEFEPRLWYYYMEKTVGAVRYFAADKNNQKISLLIEIIDDNEEINADSDIVKIDDNEYTILQIQNKDDVRGNPVRWLTLARKE